MTEKGADLQMTEGKIVAITANVSDLEFSQVEFISSIIMGC